MHNKAHWASDVIIGAVAGHLITKLAMNKFNHNEENRNGDLVYPGVDPKTGTFMLYLEWKELEPKRVVKCTKLPEGSDVRIRACFEENLAKKR